MLKFWHTQIFLHGFGRYDHPVDFLVLDDLGHHFAEYLADLSLKTTYTGFPRVALDNGLDGIGAQAYLLVLKAMFLLLFGN